MLLSRAQLLRGALAGAALPSFAGAAGVSGFRSDLDATPARPWTAPLPSGEAPLRFAVVGDHTGVGRPGVFDAAMRQISWLRPDFVLGVGDLIEGYTEDRAEIARQWDAVEASIARLGAPFVFTQGNHDVANAETLDAWRQRRGPGYYSFRYKGALFVILNSEDTPKPMTAPAASKFYDLVRLMQTDPDQAERDVQARIAASPTGQRGEYSFGEVVDLGDRQLGWLRDTLARNPHPRWTFVVVHKPAWKSQSPDFAKAQALLAGRPYTVFAGHTHYFTHEVLDGHDYINMATVGGIRQRNGPGTMDHVLMVDLTPTGPVWANTRLTGLMDLAGETGQVRAY
jgi:3',5'-cyclic AMP phosphodiesterase CpdA